jgi:hypothetical protein
MTELYSPSASELKFGDFNDPEAKTAKDPIESAAISESFVKDKIVYYRLTVKTKSGDEFKIRKRYRHFQDLQNRLGKLLNTEKLPALPKKQMKALVDHTTREFVSERQFQMNNYIQDLISLSQATELSSDICNSIQMALEEFFTSHRLSDEDPTMTEDEYIKMVRQSRQQSKSISDQFKSFLRQSKSNLFTGFGPNGGFGNTPASSSRSARNSTNEDDESVDDKRRGRAKSAFVKRQIPQADEDEDLKIEKH